MSDPLARPSSPPNLWDFLPPTEPLTTQQEGMAAASTTRARRYIQIVDLIRQRGPLAGWEIAEALGCGHHQISGRLSEMLEKRMIEDTGERRKNPRTNVGGRVVRLPGQSSIEESSNRV